MSQQLPSADRIQIFDVGCGVGHMLFPLIEISTRKHLALKETEEEVDQKMTEWMNSPQHNFRFWGIDISKRAIEEINQNPLFPKEYSSFFVSDAQKDEFPKEIPLGTIDVALLIFVLSTISPEHMLTVLHNIHSSLRADGVLLFRDYGEGDEKHILLEQNNSQRKLGENFYARPDGTRVFFFSQEFFCDMATKVGFEIVHFEKENHTIVNRKESREMKRVWVTAKLKKKK